MTRNAQFCEVDSSSIKRYANGDWGDLWEEDRLANEAALIDGERIFARYNSKYGTIYIITEWDRSVTTILFADEY
jgi:hypothetical protein